MPRPRVDDDVVELQGVLGVEGGGTKTEWVLLSADQRVIKSGILPPANLRLVTDEALSRMLAVLPSAVSHVGVFLAGCVDPDDRSRLRTLVEHCWPRARVSVGSDRESGFAVAFGERDGITVIAGTGSAVTGRSAGRIEKAGGWGQLLGDKGGGYNLSVQALRRVLSDYDIEHRVDALGQAVLRALCLNRLEDLVAWASIANKMSVAMLAPVVFEAAANGHGEMQAALEGGARILAEFTRAVASRLELAAPQVKLLGGLFRFHPEYGSLYESCLREVLPKASVSVCHESGALGAAWLAARDPAMDDGSAEIELRSDSQNEITIGRDNVASTEQLNPRSKDLDRLSTSALIELFAHEEHCVAAAIETARDELVAAVDLVSHALQNSGRLFYIGAGTSGRLGVLDASEIPPTFGASPDLVQAIIAGGATALHSAVEGAEDQAEAGALAIAERGVTARDIVCGITASGRTPFVLGGLSRARAIGAKTMLLTCNPARSKNESTACDVEIDLAPGPEIIAGSTRLKAGTATKLALNIISSCSMIRLGKVRGNLMVDVNPSNAKLRDRAVRIVREIQGCSAEAARALLEKNEWNVRAAASSDSGVAPAE
ncbi:MAG TPA: N-acetylmuramic acid 6-phosphate etherase [Chthoniobacterales bacterium]